MSRRAEELSGGLILVMCAGIGILLLVAGERPLIPLPAWAALFGVSLAAVLVAASAPRSRALELGSYGAAVVTSWIVMGTMPQQGMLAVLLVVIAAVGTYVVSLRVTLTVVGLNCLVIAASMALHRADLVEASASTVFYLFIHLAAVFSSVALNRESRLRRELEQRTVELTAASVVLEAEARNAERLRISRELHDQIGHQLTVLNLELEAARHRAVAEAESHLVRAAGVAKELLADVRRTVGQLRAQGDLGVEEALRRIAAGAADLEVRVDVDPEVELDEEQTAALIRAGQEIITNTLRHAEAHELGITIAARDGRVTLQAADDGRGSPEIRPGHGLTGVRERIGHLGGEVAFEGRRGFQVEAWFPVSRDRVGHGR
ncbi:sensor histidine kinase [Nesterenkonia xinjiangensis]|uniref:Signal transduction histidine kinase n=1 Tax=Nesterenkonia xinjiangensis TaxID=225327 RepID=A0A7Z0K8F5_9MICC|nr:histidine kinase [Nesterenkonia xinjiangensis]NYJ76608.1 signal transduction histidine kinase [Nesterenkonia xinjiangensis]